MGVALSHATLLRLPYFWDEGGYYVPAALDFYHRWTLIPEFTNAHPPLPNVVLGLAWHVFGYHIPVTRLCAAAFAAAALTAVFALGSRLLHGKSAGLTLAGLTACYPIWFAQSTLAHADIFAAAFTLSAFTVYFGLPSRNTATVAGQGEAQRLWLLAALFSLAALSKETAIAEPAILCLLELSRLIRMWQNPVTRRRSMALVAVLCFPVLPLLAWYAWHHHVTGFTFGNPEYLRYNATANFNAAHIAQALRYRALHLFWQRMIWVPLLLAFVVLLLPERGKIPRLLPVARNALLLLIVGNWMFFSVLGGALLTRYLLPVYPLLLLICIDTWQVHTRHWYAFAIVTAAAFIPALWLNPRASFAPEDNLTYRDMVVAHQQAIEYVAEHFPAAHILTAWPVAADLVRPELGYTERKLDVVSLEDFTRAEVEKAAAHPERFDTVIIFPTRNVYARRGPWDGRPTAAQAAVAERQRELSPEEVARLLGGKIVFRSHQGLEWAAVIRVPRAYDASLTPPPNHLQYTQASTGLPSASAP